MANLTTRTQPTTAWKFLRLRDDALMSEHGGTRWQIGVWQTITGKPEACAHGFHASRLALDALTYVKGEVVAHVEVAGAHADEGDKSAWQRMRVVRAWYVDKDFFVRLAIHAVEQVVHLYEDKYPADNRPRRAIEAARTCLTDHSADAAAVRAAARADAYAAYAAAYAAYAAAARAAYAADAYAAYAAYAAAYAAYAAAYGADVAYADYAADAYAAAAADAAAGNGNKQQAWDEARQEMRERLSAWMEQQIVTECQPYQPVAKEEAEHAK